MYISDGTGGCITFFVACVMVIIVFHINTGLSLSDVVYILQHYRNITNPAANLTDLDRSRLERMNEYKDVLSVEFYPFLTWYIILVAWVIVISVLMLVMIILCVLPESWLERWSQTLE